MVSKLLVRNPAYRLGTGKGGAADVKRHPWFGGFDWAAFSARTMRAPYVPQVGARFVCFVVLVFFFVGALHTGGAHT